MVQLFLRLVVTSRFGLLVRHYWRGLPTTVGARRGIGLPAVLSLGAVARTEARAKSEVSDDAATRGAGGAWR
jgi:hypothetical protein